MTNGNLVIDVFLEDLELGFREIIDGAIDGLSAGDERNLMIYIRTVRGELLEFFSSKTSANSVYSAGMEGGGLETMALTWTLFPPRARVESRAAETSVTSITANRRI